MSCKSLLYTALTTTTQVNANEIIPVGNLVRRFGKAIVMDGNNITLLEPGYYNVSVNITAVPASAGTITATILENGIPVSGANTSAAAVADTTTAMTIPSGTIRVYCYSTKSVAVSINEEANISNMSLTITKE